MFEVVKALRHARVQFAVRRQARIEIAAHAGAVLLEAALVVGLVGIQLPLHPVQRVVVAAEQVVVVAELMPVLGAARVQEVRGVGGARRRVADRPRAFVLRVDGDPEPVARVLVFEVVARDGAAGAVAFVPVEGVGQRGGGEERGDEGEAEDAEARHGRFVSAWGRCGFCKVRGLELLRCR